MMQYEPGSITGHQVSLTRFSVICVRANGVKHDIVNNDGFYSNGFILQCFDHFLPIVTLWTTARCYLCSTGLVKGIFMTRKHEVVNLAAVSAMHYG